MDLVLIAGDVVLLARDEIANGGANRTTNLLALGADVAAALVPGATGAGPAVRVVRSVQDLEAPNEAFGRVQTSGTEQVTRGPTGVEHAARSEHMAREIVAKVGSSNVASIHYHQRLSTIFPGVTDRRLPDVVVILKNGNVYLGEVASPSQTTLSQAVKLNSMKDSLAGRMVETLTDDELSKESLRRYLDDLDANRPVIHQ